MEMQLYGIALVPLVLGIIEVAKQVGMPIRWAPLLSLLLGLGAGFAMHNDNISQAIVTGLMVGLSASGLYSASKTMIGR